MANRLADETSPYLQQHAHNPVDWYPWSEDALDRARSEDRPILLSIGYSACHWCHVMERESFEDGETARFMNEHFVNIKVDREERPDIDSIYIRAVQAMTGQGGWPLTVVMTPEGVPFFGGTYFPPEPRHGMPAFRQVLQATANAFRDRREEIERAGEEVVQLLRRGNERTPGEGIGEERREREWQSLVDQGASKLLAAFDPIRGGFGRAPKFPQPVNLELLLRHHLRTGYAGSLSAVEITMERMTAGGLYDAVGGGFHRYSVDAAWIVPHFEKMLYDNAQLARTLTQLHQITGEANWARFAVETLEWVVRELGAPEGGFYSALDADSGGGEGLFYTWTPEELAEVLGPERAAWFGALHSVTGAGNFEGRSVLHRARSLHDLAASESIPLPELLERLDRTYAELRAAREPRERPFRDEKILVAWNGLTIRAFAEAGAALGRLDFIETAERAARFLLDRLHSDDGLLRVWKDGPRPIRGFLEDYASLGNALLSLHEATLDPRWLEPAERLAREAVERFRDEDSGLFFDSAHDAEALVMRPRDVMDSALPSGTSLMTELLLRLSEATGAATFRAIAIGVLEAEWEALDSIPAAFGRLLSCVDRAHAPAVQIVMIGTDEEELDALRDAAHSRWFRNGVIVGGTEGDLPSLPLFENRGSRDGRSAAYVCRDYACEAPTTDPGELREQIAALAPLVPDESR